MKLLPLRKLLMPDRLTPAGVALLYAAFAALWILSSGYLLTLTVDDPLLQSRIELAKGLAFVSVTGGLLYLLLKGWRESIGVQQTTVQADDDAAPKTTRLVPIFVALVLIVPLIDFAIYKLHVPQTELAAYDNLKSIAQIKAGEIKNWLSERRGDAQGLTANAGFAQRVEHFLLHQKHDARLPRQILNELDSLRANYGYDSILLLDTGGRLLSSMGKCVDTPPSLLHLLRQSLSGKQIQFSDLYRDEAGHINLDWVVPITVSDQNGRRAVAAVVLRVLPEKFLYPRIQTWPTASTSGEILLVRREGESVMFLNQLRLSKIAALTVSGSLSDPVLPAAIAIRDNKPGTVSGTGSRHVQVFAAYRPVAGTDWHLIAKIDRDEVMMPMWNLLYWVSVIASAAVALIMAILLMLSRQQQRAHRLALEFRSMEVLKESEHRFRAVAQSASDAIVTVDSSGNVVDLNPGAERMFGYGEAELKGQPLSRLIPERYRDLHRAGMARVLAGGEPRVMGKIVELAGLRKDGSEFPLELSLAQWEIVDDRYFTAIIRDITERKHTLGNMVASEIRYRRLFEAAKDGILILDAETGMIVDVNPYLIKMLNFSHEEFLGKKIWDLGFFKDILANQLNFAELQQNEYLRYEDMPLETADGQMIHVEFVSNVYLVNGRKVIQCNIRDITQRWIDEKRIRRLTQLYAALSQCNGAIVHCTSAEELFPQICRDAVQFGGMSMAWIGLVDEVSKRIKPVASYGAGTEYLEGIQISVDAGDPFGRGPTGTAIRDNQPYWNQDFQLDLNTAPWRERREKYGWKASAALPLCRNGIPIGSLTLYSDTVNAFNEEARRLLVEMAMDISFALDNFVREAERKHAEQELIDSEQRFRGLVEQSLAGIYIIQDRKLAYVNPRCTEILGQGSVDELVGQDLLQYVAEADRGRIAENMQQLFEKDVPNIASEFSLLRRDGATITIGVNASRATYHGQLAIIGMAQDISEKKRAEAQISGYVTQLKAVFLSTVKMATSLGEMRDPYTAGHQSRVAEIAVAIATGLGWDEQRIEGLRIAGFLHDIGKISIPAEILVKPGRLTATELALVQGHAQASYDVLKHVEFPWSVATVALQHHERMDGSGYPNGLKGDQILLEARIMAVADVVEAMASHRPYRPGLGIEKALAEIEHGSGTSYDPVVADACLRLFREQGYVLPAN